ncbi:MAG: hypothetical protein Aurels2KO_33310 [Aureliella sp.]
MDLANDKRYLLPIAVGVVIFGALLLNRRDLPRPESTELTLIWEIQEADSELEREQLIRKLEDTPVDHYPFYSRWIRLNDVTPFHCWTDDGYDETLSEYPRDVQILAAMIYGHSDIENGGFLQFFTNSTGAFAPEMLEWLERSELDTAADVLREAMAVFGETFPRSRGARLEFLSEFDGESRQQRDPFSQMDDAFYASLPYATHTFDRAADEWLRETCGIKRLGQRAGSPTQ